MFPKLFRSQDPISFKKWGKEDQGTPLDLGEGLQYPARRVPFIPWYWVRCRYAVHGAPTGWARGDVGEDRKGKWFLDPKASPV